MKEQHKKIQSQLQEEGMFRIGKIHRRSEPSPEMYQPGQLITFEYKGEDYSALVVSTKTNPNGPSYTSPRTRNKLFTCIKMNFNLTSHNIFLQQIYNNEKRATYKKFSKRASWLRRWFSFTKGSMRRLLVGNVVGKSNFRTFIFKEMRDIARLDLVSTDMYDQDEE